MTSLRAMTGALLGLVASFAGIGCGAAKDSATTTTTSTKASSTTATPGGDTPLTDARRRAQNLAVQSKLRVALTGENVYFTDNERYTDEPAILSEIEPSLQYSKGLVAPTAAGTINVAIGALGRIVCLTGVSESGAVFVLAADASSGTRYGTLLLGACDQAGLARLSATGW